MAVGSHNYYFEFYDSADDITIRLPSTGTYSGPDVSISTYTVTVTTSGLPSSTSTTAYADGINKGSISGGGTKTLTFDIGTTHSISVDTLFSGGTGVRYVCTNTSQSVSGADSLTFNYKTQYYFTVETEPSELDNPQGSGWYDSGTTATASVSAVGGYTFQYWTGDASGTGLSTTVTMNAPKTATAYYVKMQVGEINFKRYPSAMYNGQNTHVWFQVTNTGNVNGDFLVEVGNLSDG
ncbi:MAG: hypothetical protein AEth_00319 [Candidatus Argoarchaeum ethanivorans]|uniref:Bacterial repeat domain-containing protein n=1 Tax=Candidatus Argoarchaeum ethanivorans TaxID=2608793 RepID=A0A8B3S367_9EURY|nr:MAG: hypothetical protein AEth_00319 [Candidatus Argoarchaeum ethanivorans]